MYEAKSPDKIKKVEVEKETKCFVWVKSEISDHTYKNAKQSDYKCYFETESEAVQHLTEIARDKVEREELRLTVAKDNLELAKKAKAE